MELALFIGLPAVLAAGYFLWKFWWHHDIVRLSETPTRRREDARDWQRRFGADSLLATHFLQPTQNEILETLYALDHLTPDWESGDPNVAERYFLNELALNFPSLRKVNCEFPLPFAERSSAKTKGSKVSGKGSANEPEIAVRREEFRIARAHANALEQMVLGPAQPTVLTPGSLPFRVPPSAPARDRGNPWPARLAGATVLGAAVFGIVRLLPDGASSSAVNREAEAALALVTPVPTPAAPELSPPVPSVAETEATDTPAPSLEPVATAVETLALQTPSPTPVAVAVTTPAVVAAPPPSTPDPAKAALAQQIAASKQRALSKYPDLAVEGSEINLRFVFRYKTLIQQNSPRLLNPNWPEQLVEECATAAAGGSLKHPALTQVSDTHH